MMPRESSTTKKYWRLLFYYSKTTGANLYNELRLVQTQLKYNNFIDYHKIISTRSEKLYKECIKGNKDNSILILPKMCEDNRGFYASRKYLLYTCSDFNCSPTLNC